MSSLVSKEEALPEGWALARISDCTELVTSGSRGWGKFYSRSGAIFIRVGDFRKGDISLRHDKFVYVSPPEGAEGTRTEVLPNDVLLTITADVGMVAVAGAGLGKSYVNQHVALLRPSEGLSGRFFGYSLLDPMGFQREIRASQYGATKPGLSLVQVRGLEVSFPPRPEQHRIVEALDSYLTRLDAATEGLKRVEANLKRYRASVLKAAVEGRLVPTEAELARREGRDYEPASVLLERILKERRRRWEESELAKMKAKGKVPANDKWKSKYKEPIAPAVEGLPELPEGWCWATVDQLAEVSGGITKNPSRRKLSRKIPYLRVGNVYADELRLSDIRNIGVSEAEFERVLLQPDDLLIVEGNGSLGQVGRVAIWTGHLAPCGHQNHLIKCRFAQDNSKLLANWNLNWLLSPDGRDTITKVASSTSGLHTLSLSKVKRLVVPLAPLQEQARANGAVAATLSTTASSSGMVVGSILRIQRLRQSILKWAFEGKLVDQDPNDEPASVLLERIRQERQQAAPKKRPRRRKSSTKS